MTIWQPKLNNGPGPKYNLILEAIGESISDGSLAEGDRMPPQRDLAYQLGMSLNTVSRAYAEAVRCGFLHGEVGRGTFVRSCGPLPAEGPQARMTRPDEGPIDFRLNLPAVGEGAAVLAQTLEDLSKSKSLASYLDFQEDGDLARHTGIAAQWMGELGLQAVSEQVVLTNGAQNGVMAALLAVLRPGDVLLTETLTYAPLKAMAQHLGLTLFPLALDEGGLVPAALDEACQKTAAKALYCLPTLHTPTTVTMTEERRGQIAEIARKHDLAIIEDDVFGFLPPDRPPPLASFAPERSIFITSLSKCLAPGLRIGYIHAPHRFYLQLRAAVSLSCWMPAPLMAEIASRWIEEGTAQRLNDFQRTEAQARQLLARRSLGNYHVQADPSGFHLWLPLPDHWRADTFRAAAEKQGVKVVTAETFAVEQTAAPQAIRLCLSHEASRGRVARGLEIVAKILGESDHHSNLIV